MPWYCVRTKTKREREVAHALGRQGFEPYLPMARDEGSTEAEPLFSRYVFAKFSGGDFHLMTKTPNVVKVVKFGREEEDEYAIIPDNVIEALKAQEDKSGFHVIPEGRFAVGSRVRITSGAAYGYEAVIHARKPDRLILFLSEVFNGKFQVTASYDEVEPAS